MKNKEKTEKPPKTTKDQEEMTTKYSVAFWTGPWNWGEKKKKDINRQTSNGSINDNIPQLVS